MVPHLLPHLVSQNLMNDGPTTVFRSYLHYSFSITIGTGTIWSRTAQLMELNYLIDGIQKTLSISIEPDSSFKIFPIHPFDFNVISISYEQN